MIIWPNNTCEWYKQNGLGIIIIGFGFHGHEHKKTSKQVSSEMKKAQWKTHPPLYWQNENWRCRGGASMGGKRLQLVLLEMMFLLKTLHIKMHKTHLLIPSPQNHLCSFIPDKNTIWFFLKEKKTGSENTNISFNMRFLIIIHEFRFLQSINIPYTNVCMYVTIVVVVVVVVSNFFFLFFFPSSIFASKFDHPWNWKMEKIFPSSSPNRIPVLSSQFLSSCLHWTLGVIWRLRAGEAFARENLVENFPRFEGGKKARFGFLLLLLRQFMLHHVAFILSFSNMRSHRCQISFQRCIILMNSIPSFFRNCHRWCYHRTLH